MPLDLTGIDVELIPEPDQGQVLVRWSGRPPGATYQVYVDGRLVETTLATSTTIPWPAGPVDVSVGAVDASEAAVPFAVPVPLDRALVEWTGGRYLDPGADGLYDDLAEFRVYGSPGPGLPVDAGAALAIVPPGPNGVAPDGAGVGRAGFGLAGRSEVAYRWTSGRLAAGTWAFRVLAFDKAGNPGADPVADATITIVAPPAPPRADAEGRRLRATLDETTRVATLSWDNA